MDKPVIGMIHLRLLPGSPKCDPVDMGMDKTISIALEKAAMLEQAGVDGVQVRNMWGTPYLRSRDIGHEAAAALVVGIRAIRNKVSVPMGAECHINGADCAIACTVVAETSWIRVFEWCSIFVSQSDSINTVGTNVSRVRSRLKAGQILALCDVDVKHESHYIIHDRSVAEQTMGIESQDGDAVIATGSDIGTLPSVESISKCKKSTSLPMLMGSGLNGSNVNEPLTATDGAIIGSWFKEGNNWKNPVNYDRTKELMDRIITLRQA